MFNSGYRNRRAADGRGVIGTQTQYLQTISPAISVSSWSISGSDDTALDPAGGQTVLVNGSGFAVGVSATVGGTQIGAVTIVSSTQISFTSPANAGGSYSLVVYNVDGSAGILVPGLVYSAVPAWTTAAGSIGSFYETTAISTAVVATADSALTYSLSSGSLPVGSTLYANGVITGTAPVDSSSTTYTFAVTATDAELQDTTRTFTLTVNVDVVTWVTPSTSATITLDGSAYSQALSATDAAGYAVSYTANTLPTGLTLSSGTISGTPTVEGNTSSLLTATAATTNRSATNTVTWVVQLNDSYFKYITLGLSASSSLTTGSFVADNSLNNAQLTVFGDTRAQKSNPYQFGYYSTYHSASGVYLTGSNSLFNISSGTMSWCFEGWVYPIANGYYFAIGSGGAYGNSFTFTYGGGTANKFSFYQGTGSSNAVAITTTNTYSFGRWYHVAITKDAAGVIRLFINGTQDGTQTYTGSVGSGTTFVINGLYDNNGLGNNGGSVYVSNYRFVINQPVYTANFTPSTAPLLNIPGTILLTCQSNRFVDNGPLNLAITLGSTPQINAANPFTTVYQASTQYYATLFNGSSDYLSVADSPTLELGSSSFTIELWLYSNTTAQAVLVGKRANQITNGPVALFKDSSNVIKLYLSTGTSGWDIINGATIGTVANNQWYHIAVTRSGSTFTGYFNGVSVSLGTSSATVGNTADSWTIGADTNGNYLNGYISNLRIVKGLAVYTGNFVPATAPLSTTQSAGTNIAAITQPSYSVSFNGSSQYLTLPTSTGLQLGSLDFTFEGWMYLNDTTDRTFVYWNGDTGGDAAVHVRTISGKWALWISKTGTSWEVQQSALGTASANTWYHVAVVRNSTNIRLYINGSDVTGGGYTVTGSLMTTYTLNQIGTYNNGYYFMNGYISNIRLTLNQALYTANFTPTTSPLTTTSQSATAANVSLLTCQSTTIVDNSLNLFAITNTGTAAVASPNPFATSTVSLLTVQSPTFVDNSYNSLTITAATTTVKPLARSPFTPLYYSNYFNGASSISLANTSQAVLNVTTGATFTIEAWVNLSSLAATRTFIADNVPGNATAYWAGEITTGGYLKFWWYSGSQIACTATTTAMVVGTWYHVAVVANAGALSLYVNGTPQSLSGTTTLSAPGGNTASIAIGQYGSPSVYMLGYISNLRITKSQALYTTTFTPSTTPLTTTSQSASAANVSLLTCQSPYFIDGSTTSRAITQNSAPQIAGIAPFAQPGGYSETAVSTYGSGYFDGTGDYITWTGPAPTTGYQLTGQFTAECWFYVNTTSAGEKTLFVFNSVTGGLSYGGIRLDVDAGGTAGALQAPISTSGSAWAAVITSSGGLYSKLTWNHAAVTRDSNNLIRVFLNGIQIASATVSGTLYYNSYQSIGCNQPSSPSGLMNGYITDVRFVNGTALYTSAFVPSFTTPLTAVTNTQFLSLQTRGAHNNSDFIDQSSFNNVVTKTGNATNGTFSPYGNNFSVNFYGAGSLWLSFPAGTGTAADMGTGDFTLECWTYLTSRNYLYPAIYDTGGTTTRLSIFAGHNSGSSTKYQFSLGAASTSTVTSIIYNAWTHLALVRTGTTIKLYINGVADANTVTSSASASGSTTAYIGGSAGDAANCGIVGNISNFRMVKGTALYTTTFTPPTTPLTAVAGTTFLSLQSYRYIDNSVSNATITPSGVPPVQKFSPFSTVTLPTYYSGYFDGNGDYLSVPSSSAFAIPTSTTPFTIEAWIYPTAAGGSIFTDTYTASDSIPISLHLSNGSVVDNTGGQVLTFAYYNGSSWTNCAMANTNVTLNQWQHVAAVFTGSTCKLFIAGADVTKSSSPTPATTWGVTNDNGSAWLIGRRWDTFDSPYFTGFISNFRFTKGQALYTSAFTPSTTPLTTTSQSATASNVSLLTCQSNTFIDNSPNYFAVTAYADAKPLAVSPFTPTAGSAVSYTPAVFGGSMYFDGNEYAYSPTAGSLFVYPADFTIEFWVYPTAPTGGTYTPTFYTNNSNGDWGSNGNGMRVQYSIAIFGPSAGFSTLTYTSAIQQGVWQHVAFVRSGSTITMYKNGVANGTLSYSATIGAANNWPALATSDGAGSGGREFATGYYSDWRITNGVALYKSNFYPGASPATPTYTIGTTVYNSALLVSGAVGGVIDYSRTVDLETVADAKVTPFSPYNGSYYSYQFNGSSDYLTTSRTGGWLTSGGNFTIEFWAYLTGYTPASTGVYNACPFGTSGASNGWEQGFSGTASSYTGYNFSFKGVGSFTATYTFSLGVWYHIAIVKSGSTTTIYINGVSSATTTSFSTWTDNAAMNIGQLGVSGYNFWFPGRLSNARIVNGTAVYTSNFTPSTAPLTAISNTVLLTAQSNKFVDNSSNAYTISVGGGTPRVATPNPFQTNSGISYYFDGTGDYLTMPENTALWYLGTGDFTIEAWVNPAARVANSAYIIGRSQYGVGSDWAWWITNSGTLQFYMLTGGGGNIVTSTGTVPLNAWTFVTVVRSSAGVKLYINGVNDGTLANYAGTLTASYGPTVVGNSSNNGGSTYFNGYITDLRFTRGYARYSSNFTPPTAPYKTN